MRSSIVFRLSLPQKALAYCALFLLSVPAILPLLWMISTSLKSDTQIFAQGSAGTPPITLKNLLPHPFVWQNYPNALKAIPFLTYLQNTILLCVVTVIGACLSSAVVAYGFARIPFKGSKLLFMVMISTMALPTQVTMIPVFALFRWLGWYGTYLPLTIPAYFGTPFYIFLLTQFYKSLPNELSEAARVDGASEWLIFSRVILPLSKSALVTCALFQFMGTWNDFFGPLLYINDPTRYTLAYGLQQFLSTHDGEWTQLMAAATLFTAPIILLFFFAQRIFIQGIATTGGKN